MLISQCAAAKIHAAVTFYHIFATSVPLCFSGKLRNQIMDDLIEGRPRSVTITSAAPVPTPSDPRRARRLSANTLATIQSSTTAQPDQYPPRPLDAFDPAYDPSMEYSSKFHQQNPPGFQQPPPPQPNFHQPPPHHHNQPPPGFPPPHHPPPNQHQDFGAHSEHSFGDSGYTSQTPMSNMSHDSFDISTTGMTPGAVPPMTPNMQGGNFFGGGNQYGMPPNTPTQSGSGGGHFPFQAPPNNQFDLPPPQQSPMKPQNTYGNESNKPYQNQRDRNVGNDPRNRHGGGHRNRQNSDEEPSRGGRDGYRDKNRDGRRDRDNRNSDNRNSRDHRDNRDSGRGNDRNSYNSRPDNRGNNKYNNNRDRGGHNQRGRYDRGYRNDRNDRDSDRYNRDQNDRDFQNRRNNRDSNRFDRNMDHNEKMLPEKLNPPVPVIPMEPPTPAPVPVARPKTPELPPKPKPTTEEEPRSMSLESRIQSLLTGMTGMSDTFGSPNSDSATDSQKKDQTPPPISRGPGPRTPEPEPARVPPLPYESDAGSYTPQTPYSNAISSDFYNSPHDAHSHSYNKKQPNGSVHTDSYHSSHSQPVMPQFSHAQTVDTKQDSDDDRMSISSGGSGEQNIEINPPLIQNTSTNQPVMPTESNYVIPTPAQANQWQPPQMNNAFGTSMLTGGFGVVGDVSSVYNQNYYNQFVNNCMNDSTATQESETDHEEEKQEQRFASVLEGFVNELKEIMQKDMCKKMVESSAFKSLDGWWVGEENKNKFVSIICHVLVCCISN